MISTNFLCQQKALRQNIFFQLEKTVKLGSLLDVKKSGEELAEQFISKYPNSFKLRLSDKLSAPTHLTYIQELCRERRVEKAKTVFAEVLAGQCSKLEDQNRDLDALLDLFAFFNVTEDTVDWPVTHVSAKAPILNFTFSLSIVA